MRRRLRPKAERWIIFGFEVKGLEAFCNKLEADGMPFDMTYRVIPQLDGAKTRTVFLP